MLQLIGSWVAMLKRCQYTNVSVSVHVSSQTVVSAAPGLTKMATHAVVPVTSSASHTTTTSLSPSINIDNMTLKN